MVSRSNGTFGFNAWGAIGSVFLGPFLWALFSRRVGKRGAFAGAILGLGTCLVLFAIGGVKMVPQAGSLGMIVSFVVPPAASLLAREGQSPSGSITAT